MPLVGFGSCWWRLPGVGSDKACSTPSSYLDKILKRHGRVTLKNYGSVYETSCQDLQLSVGSEFMFSTQDENILRFIVLNACSSTYWSVIGHVMDSNAINELGKYLMEEQMNMPAMPNLSAREVYPVDILAEARNEQRSKRVSCEYLWQQTDQFCPIQYPVSESSGGTF
ncbi:hypothetical protein Cgig2_028590 [Carnegiea gigantea]|uniref:CST complex subunit CTC1 n=1 Tax=Carnegiea gigantea TaxID=171969 RepID=A0A9Q1QD14_9CARY|nr:hypothetical protein Cgig2_028590 [Carnegiea gigantea]